VFAVLTGEFHVRSTPFRLTVLVAVAALAACSQTESNGVAERNTAAVPQAEIGKGVDRSHRGSPAPDAEFVNGDGEQASLSALGDGKPLLVNLWASWCAPCVKELPTLDGLSQMPNAPVQVAAISQDDGPHASVEAFLATHKIANLEAYQDKDMALSGALKAQNLPTSVLFDAKGREVWRYTGDLDWTSPEAAKLLSEAKG
jgi:thiol-disulfide isomerase/thioredoxin